MTPEQYTGKEWDDLLRMMDGRQVKKSLRSAIRAEATRARRIAQSRLTASGLHVRGNQADWSKGIRARLYPMNRGGAGFMITVKPRGANRQGKGEKSMHLNRQGLKKPILMWAEDGTSERRTKTKTRWFVRMRRSHPTGTMPAYHFMEHAEPEMFTTVEADLLPEVEKAVQKQARKAGFI